jgi:exodeoxyribonuclease VII large subunit
MLSIHTNQSQRKVFTLVQVCNSISKTILNRYGTAFWLKAEISKLNYYKYSGHCYPDLVEKQNGKVVAQMRSIIWKNEFIQINKKFTQITTEPLKDGIKVLMYAKIGHDAKYGLFLNILDIDPSFTLGDIEQEKNETIRFLIEKGIFNKNKLLKFPFLPKRIAIISVETSKGYADFMKILTQNEQRFKFELTLFPSLLQGDDAVTEIIQNLNKIEKQKEKFDVVVIVRGGGGDIGLTCYNKLPLCESIANYSLPILTGIGHATNETVAEQVAYYNAITPTNLADFLLNKFLTIWNELENFARILKISLKALLQKHYSQNQNCIKSITQSAQITLSRKNFEIQNIANLIQLKTNQQCNHKRQLINQIVYKINNGTHNTTQICKNAIQSSVYALNSLIQSLSTEKQDELKSKARRIVFSAQNKNENLKLKFNLTIVRFKNNLIHKLEIEKSKLENLEKQVALMDVDHILSKGFSITFTDKTWVKSINLVNENALLHTKLHDGIIVSKVKKIYTNGDK